MLVQFTLANYRSFKERTTLKLTAEALSEHQQNVFDTKITDLRLLKSLVIYGSNATGKSNMFKGMLFMRWLILNSFNNLQPAEAIDVESFKLNTATVAEPSLFEIELMVGEVKYRYGFRVNNHLVLEEWLFQIKKIKEYKLFHRHRQQFESDEKFDDGRIELKNYTRENALHLSTAAQFNNTIAIDIVRKVRMLKLMSGINDESHLEQTARMMEDPRYSRMIKQLVLSADLGFTDIKSERVVYTDEMLSKAGVPQELRPYFLKDKKGQFHVSTIHPVYNENNERTDLTTTLSLQANESLGTRKFFSMAGPIIESLATGGILLIDEFSSRMSSALCESIIRLFNSQTNNPRNAQFIFITHNTQFISKTRDIFRRDQIIVFKKDQSGTTEVSSLYDERARKDASHDKEYLEKIYSVMPHLDLSSQLSLFDDESQVGPIQ